MKVFLGKTDSTSKSTQVLRLELSGADAIPVDDLGEETVDWG